MFIPKCRTFVYSWNSFLTFWFNHIFCPYSVAAIGTGIPGTAATNYGK